MKTPLPLSQLAVRQPARRPLSLRSRMILIYTLLIAAGFGGLAWLVGDQISQAARDDLVAAQQSQTELLARSLSEHVEHFLAGEEARADLEGRLYAYAEQLQRHITLVDTNGSVLIDSQGESEEGQSKGDKALHAAAITAALAGNTSAATGPDAAGRATVYAVAPVMDEGRVLGAIQTTLPLDAAAPLVRKRWGTLALGVSLLGLLAIATTWLLAASLTRPLEAMRNAAMRLAAGDLNQRLPVVRLDEIGQVATAFNTMAEQVRTMVEEQQAFAANASHELRTPLTTIRLRSEALRHEPLDSELARQYIGEIDDEATRLSGLVEDLILLARLDAGRAVRGRDEIDVARLVRGLIRESEALPEAQGTTLQLIVPTGLPALTASLNHVRVLLRNLLSNALAYTPSGGAVTCTLQSDGQQLLITVADSGQGVTAADLPHVTERFFRVDKSHTRSGKGSGLGLTLVQSIVNCYGGRMEISSPGLGLGTTVRVWWPFS
jgi:signal transduction histidine kinase